MFVLEFAISIIVECILVLKTLYYFQINSYGFPKSLKYKNHYSKLVDLSVVSMLINAFLCIMNKNMGLRYYSHISFVIHIILVVICLLEKEDNRQKLKFTKRLLRIYFVVICEIIVSTFSLIIIGIFIKDLLFFIPLIFIFYPILILMAIILLTPLEKAINFIYLSKSKSTLKKKNIRVIGITGSFGKTSTKEFLKEILSKKYKVYATPKNFNTLTGVSKSIMQIKDEEMFICEMGARHKKDIKKICNLVKPDIGIITGINGQHLETFKSIENIYNTKKELSDNVNGPVFFSSENEGSLKMFQEREGEKYLDISFAKFSEYSTSYLGSQFKVTYNDKNYIFSTKLIGKASYYDLKLAISVALYLGLSIVDIQKAVQDLCQPKCRMEITLLNNSIYLIDDSYNSNFDGVKNALEVLSSYPNRKIILTQGIVECGQIDQKEKNFEIGKLIAATCDVAIVTGVNSEYIIRGINSLESNINIIYKKSFLEAKKEIEKVIKKGDCLLIQNDLTDNY